MRDERMSNDPGWFWRWGAPLAAGAGALAAVCFAAASLWELPASQQLWTADRLRDARNTAAVFAAALVVFWTLSRAGDGTMVPARDGSWAAAVIGATAVLAGVSLALHSLDAPLRGDESMNIVGNATQPFAVAVGKYTTPGNHLLHTWLVWVAHQFGGWNRIVLRLPALLAFCLLLPALWWFVRREYGSMAAGFATVFVAASPFFVTFATSARGYTLLLLCFVWALLCAQALVRSPVGRALWAAWAAAIALGFATMPLMAFPAATTVAWMLLARWRMCGRLGMRSFAIKIAAWSAAAVAAASVLYAPVLVTEGVRGFLSGLAKGDVWWPPPDLYVGTSVSRVLMSPAFLWKHWHLAVPAWAQGVLLALVVIGFAVRGRSCGRQGTLAAALVVATGVVWTMRPFDMQPRMAIWALLVLMIAAGAGAALVMERALTLTKAQWPGSASAPARLAVARCGAAALVLGILVWWGGRPAVVSGYGGGPALSRSLPAAAAAMHGQMQSGDHFAINDRLAVPAIAYMNALYDVDDKMGWFAPDPEGSTRWRLHRLLKPRNVPAQDRSSNLSRSRPPHQRLFLFDASSDSPRYGADGVAAQDFLAAHWPDHELVAAVEGGRVYVLGPGGWPAEGP